MNFVYQHILDLCEQRGWTLYKLASKSGMGEPTLLNAIKRANYPSIPTLEKICHGFGITMSDFFADETCRRELTPEQMKLIDNYEELSREQKRLLDIYLHALRQTKPE